MEPLRVLLVCSFGMSTSLLVEAMKRAAADRAIPLEVASAGTDQLTADLSRWDVILLGPQVRYAEATARRTGRPVGIIDGFVYATANGERALAQAISLAGQVR
jgi:PTS system cellobiose-specific IIB component